MKHWAMLFAALLAALSLPAEAHTGHGIAYDFREGLGHPLQGIDHLLVMIGVGLWAGFLGGSARIWLPAGFLAAMAAGAALSFAGVELARAELAVSGSVVAIGMILACGWRASLLWAVGLAAVFAFGHGYVHAREAGADSQVWYYASGFSVATALLLAGGVLLGDVALLRGRGFKTAFGVLCAASGIGLLLGV